MWSAWSFLLAAPAILVGLKSFRISGISMVALLAWDIATTTWPHIDLGGFLDSQIDALLLTSTVLAVLVAVLSPFSSIFGFLHHIRGI
jgi:hypothetical protein